MKPDRKERCDDDPDLPLMVYPLASIIVLIAAVVISCAGCNTVEPWVDHRIERKTEPIIRRVVGEMVEETVIDWLRQIAPYAILLLGGSSTLIHGILKRHIEKNGKNGNGGKA